MIFGILFAGSPPSDLWHDPLFLAGAGVGATLLGAIIGLIPYLLSLRQSRRRFVYSIDSDVPVLRKEAGSQMKVVFNGQEVQEPRLLVVDLWNDGGVPIDPDDFEEPIAFSFTGKTEVLEADVLEAKPSHMGVRLMIARSDVILQPLLFNKGDRVRIKMLVSGLSGKLRVLSRIKGLNDIIDYQRMRRGRSRLFLYSGLLLQAIALMSFIMLLVNVQGFLVSLSSLRPYCPFPPMPSAIIILLLLFAVSFIVGGVLYLMSFIRMFRDILKRLRSG